MIDVELCGECAKLFSLHSVLIVLFFGWVGVCCICACVEEGGKHISHSYTHLLLSCTWVFAAFVTVKNVIFTLTNDLIDVPND